MKQPFDLVNSMPHWALSITVYWTAFTVGAGAFCTWLSGIMPLPSEVESKHYAIFFGVVQRISLGGRRSFKNGDSGK